MSKKKARLNRDEIYRYIFLKNEILKIILKSISKNQQIKPIIRGLCILKNQKKITYISKQKNYCLLTGKSRGTTTLTNTSRQMLNKLAQYGELTNIRSNNLK